MVVKASAESWRVQERSRGREAHWWRNFGAYGICLLWLHRAGPKRSPALARRSLSMATTTPPASLSATITAYLLWVGRWLLAAVDSMLAPLRARPRTDYYHYVAADTHPRSNTLDLADLVKSQVPSLASGFREAWWLPLYVSLPVGA